MYHIEFYFHYPDCILSKVESSSVTAYKHYTYGWVCLSIDCPNIYSRFLILLGWNEASVNLGTHLME